jgi:HlyD family secretion protein
MKKLAVLLPFILFFSCGKKKEKIKPEYSTITESVYASGYIKAKDQYQIFSTVNGIVEDIKVEEGETVKVGQTILLISSAAQKFTKENARLASAFSDVNANQDKLKEAEQLVEMARLKMKSDSSFYHRQKALWQQQIGTLADLEQKELLFQNSKANYLSARIRYSDLKKQLAFNAEQAKNNLQLSGGDQSDYTVKSEINGIVFSLPRKKGELVTSQVPLAVLGNANEFILEMQIDEVDIFKIKEQLPVYVTLDSYGEKTFEARVSKIYPIMNERNKTFIVEARFTEQPPRLYPNITFEASIVLQKKEKALLIPINYLVNDSTVLDSEKKEKRVKTGLRDYTKVEIISGLTAEEEIVKP